MMYDNATGSMFEENPEDIQEAQEAVVKVNEHTDNKRENDEPEYTVRRYRKKPVIVEAYRIYKPINIQTLEGLMHAEAGDYIITGVNGEQYPCKPDIFEKTYEALFDDE